MVSCAFACFVCFVGVSFLAAICCHGRCSLGKAQGVFKGDLINFDSHQRCALCLKTLQLILLGTTENESIIPSSEWFFWERQVLLKEYT